ncbi:MFS transporter [Pedobacter sp. SYSU D00535]|uniref:MFS transporter n=1 Tax=Pedobacter sp. SYSU D00535 TaxID=2810308 RepID=UPI001A966B91|nr:MFS transporter [Pedobacter sp. SYSU D00535]
MDLKQKQRIALSIFFFLTGFCFSTWASRIPTIKTAFGFNEAELGSLLFTMPIASLLGLPISGFLVSRFDSRIPLVAAFVANAISLLFISYSTSTLTLVAAIFLFAFSMRVLNIAMNTQAITLQKIYNRKINGAFHGLWSTGGIVGVGFSTILLNFQTSITTHFFIVTAITLVATAFAYPFLMRNDRSPSGNKLIIGKPDPFIFFLGVLAFLSALCEGGMFDWSGIYFKEVVDEEIFTAGYLIFMTFMALSRFVSDRIIDRIGMPRMFIISSVLIALGIFLAIAFPTFWPALIGFSLVGFGTASVIPMTFTLAGTTEKYSPGMTISIITTYVITGMLIGPPMIGYIAHALGLRSAFISFFIAGLLIIPFSSLVFRYKKRQQAEL